MIHATDREIALWQGGLDHAKPRKYHNKPTEVDGIKFDSKAEASRYAELKLMEQADSIRNLHVHPRFIIVDADEHGRAMHYEADFMYTDCGGGEYIVEDVKGGRATQTPLYRLKARLFQARYPHYTFKVVER